MHKLRIAVAGCGFWANYQIAAWKEFQEVEIVAACDKVIDRAYDFQKRFGIAEVFGDVERMLKSSKPDVLEIISSSDTHAHAVKLAAKYNTTVICQKPLTPTWRESKEVVELCRKKGVQLYIHENWRFQAPMRKVKQLLDNGVAGSIFRARITCSHAFPIFDNQPFLKEIEEMVIADLGVHLLDTARFFFGEADYLYAQVSRVTPGVKGEDVATILITFKNGCRCLVELSVATRQEIPHFPQTLVHIEGTGGVISVKENYEVSLVTDAGVEVINATPRHFSWVNPDYAVVHSSIYDCNKSILNAITGTGSAETSGVDNLETLRLAYAAYASAKENKVIYLKDHN
ncbi:MAG: Gfo/Idh/MocA family oxidoreductase [Cyclobacteriaceae bacterium]